MDVLLAEDDRYAALAEEFMAREYPWLTPEATQAFHAVAEQHGAQRSHELQRLIEAANLADAGQTIDTTGMTDEQFMAGLQGDLTCAGFFETATNLKLLDSDGDVGC
ncbi:MAG: hypothetical protein EOO77_29405 [Oxalobacteraceae bacterium]|nr:MAG: hypothetical protein EOO77_29405 [Oxalobacteraceae bacterium]